jgi:hypothetical protein
MFELKVKELHVFQMAANLIQEQTEVRKVQAL